MSKGTQVQNKKDRKGSALLGFLFVSLQQIIIAVNTTMKSSEKTEYRRPAAETMSSLLKELLCASPTEGGLEDVEYEDWTV